MNEGSRYAIYFVPTEESALYRFGSSVLGYDCYGGKALPYPDELTRDSRDWRSMVEGAGGYGFHGTLKAPFHLVPVCAETQLIAALQIFAASRRVIPVISPVIRMISGFIALVPRQPEALLAELAGDCTAFFDRFRAPMSPQERARRSAAGLNHMQIENLDRWGYPYVFSEFRFHMTLTDRIAADAPHRTLALLERSFDRLCGDGAVQIDRIALLKQEYSGTNFRILSVAQLT